MYKLLLIFVLLSSAHAGAKEPMRVISSGGSITEIIYALGKQDVIVATDSTSFYPATAARLPKLGYFRQLSTEGVLSFQPTHLLGAQATGPDSLVQQLQAAGVQVSILGEQRDLAGLGKMIKQVGQLVNAESEAALLIDVINKQVAELKQRNLTGRGLKALFIMSDSERGLTVAGNNTVPQALFDDAGLLNVAAELKDYKVMDNESILAANPDLIFIASHRIRDPKALQALCQHPALKATSAGQNCALVVLDSGSGLALSPRYPDALATIISSAESLHANR